MRRLLAAVLLSCIAAAGGAAAQTPLALTAKPLTLNPEDRAQETVDRLRWRGGIAVTSDDARFGGLSDLVLDANGENLTAVTDAGRWLTARLTYDRAGNLNGATNTRMGPLRDPRGLLLSGKRYQDAEALTRLSDGSLLVAFERDHRLLVFPKGGLAGLPQAVAPPPGLQSLRANAGIEALLALPDGGLLAFTEGHKAGDNFRVYLRDASGQLHNLALKPTGLFVPTAAALLPAGDVILLERRFTLLGGFGARLSRIPLTAIRPGAVLDSKEIAELRAPLTLDNFEGLAVHEAEGGTTRLTLVSDDNFSPLQRTLIVQFELVGTN
ncbi:MAG: esterase-like activity of phytase family protein [Roseitalea porphyridii]|uniref:esterase-like activity of phytase family protein n=1 Tax=Roseitalea porphyridii TaxID=1852022 RepID=UPI0032EBFDDF